jgi:hypothetical protein
MGEDMKARTYVYCSRRQGGFEFGLDAVTPVAWTFTRGNVVPRHAYTWYSCKGVDQAKLAALPDTVVCSLNELRRKVASGEVAA